MNATKAPMNDDGNGDFKNRTTAAIAVETSILLLLGLFAIGGNLLVVISIYRNPSLRTITNYFVLSLSIPDMLYPSTNLPFVLVWSITNRYTFENKNLCECVAIVTHSLVAVSILTMVLMAINRFVRVCKPNEYKKWFNKKTCLIMIAAVWICTFTFMTVNIMDKTLFHARFNSKKMLCVVTGSKKNRIVVGFITSLSIGCPFLVILYCYYKIFKKIREHKRNIAPSKSNDSNLGMSVQEIKVTWTMFAVLIGYCATWIPFLAILGIAKLTKLSREADMVVTYCLTSSSAINPFIYGVMNTMFRREYKKIIQFATSKVYTTKCMRKWLF